MPRPGVLQQKRRQRTTAEQLPRVAGFAHCIRKAITQLQVDSSVLGRRWINREGLHQTSEVQKLGDSGVLILKAWYAREIGLMNGAEQ